MNNANARLNDDNEPDSLHAGLRAAYGDDSGAGLWGGAAVLATIGESSGGGSSIHLPDAPDDATGVLNPRSSAIISVPPGSGRFQIAGEIARGGIGVILRGRDMDLGREVALKLLRSEHADNPAMIRRLVEEAQIGGQLEHAGVLPVYEMGLDPARRPYFAMKLVRGQALSTILQDRSDPTRDRPRFVEIFDKICHTIAYAHTRGVIHRDLKPSNIMVGAFGEVQVVDWGLAKVIARGADSDDRKPNFPAAEPEAIATVRNAFPGSSHSEAGSVLGTPAYMAPEQARGEVDDLDERCDVFALGAILCEILTGRPPYSGSRTELLRKAAAGELDEAICRLDACREDVVLGALARQCLALARDDRPRSATHVAREVSAYRASVEERARASELEAATESARARSERRARWLMTALATVLLIAVGLASTLLRVERDRRFRIENALKVLGSMDAKSGWILAHAAQSREADAAQWLELVRLTRQTAERSAAGAVDDDTRRRAEELINALKDQEAELVKKVEKLGENRRPE
jgi:serine/threonine-protein kinase